MRDEKMTAARKSGQMDWADRLLYVTLFAVSYPLCLLVAITNRLTGIFGHDAMEKSQSVFAEAKSAVHAAVGYAFHA